MALYSYEALSKDGKRVRGVIDAPSAGIVKEMLGKQGFFPVSIERAKEGAQLSWYQKLFTRGVTLKELVLFTRQFVVLLKAGTPLVQALELLLDQFKGRLGSMLVQIKDEVKEGGNLADALNKFPDVFGTIYVQLVRAGEASGNLEMILDRLTDYLEKRQEQIRQVKRALMMPLIQLTVAGLVVLLLLVKVVPGMVSFIQEQGGELPQITSILLAVSNFVRSYYLFTIAAIAAGYIGLRYWSRTPKGGEAIDRLKLRLPLIKYLTRTGAVVQFSYTLGVLLESGVNISEALDIVCDVVDNRILANTLREARENILKEGKITEYLDQTGLFPAIAIYLIRTGEESGKLGQMLLVVARNYEDDMKELSARLTTILGPITLIIMTIVVGFVVIAVVLPMLTLGETMD